MMRFIIHEPFTGRNEDGLTFEEFIKEDVLKYIKSFVYYRDNIHDEDGEIDWLNLSSQGNARFVLSTYYYKYLDKWVPGEPAKELKEIIKEEIGENELLEIVKKN